jgi:hypothetical protein
MRTCAQAFAAPETPKKDGAADVPVGASEEATPEDCDRIVAEIRYRNIPIPSQLDLSLARRLKNFWNGVIGLLRATYLIVASIPGSLAVTSRMSFSEWRQLISGWWATVQHEAQHYWVRDGLQKLRRLALLDLSFVVTSVLTSCSLPIWVLQGGH